jgi:protein SCO1/2
LQALILFLLWAVGNSFGVLAAEGPAIDLDEARRVSQAAIGRIVPDYSFTNASGRRLRLSQYRGKPLLVSFVYTGCFQVCPVTTQFLGEAVGKAQEALGSDRFQVLSIGFNLPYDTPEALRAFALKQGIRLPNWEFVSPDAGSVEALTRDFGFMYAPTPKGIDHLTQLTLVDAEGRIVGKIYGETFALSMLVEPLKTLLAGQPAPAGGWSAWLENVRIICSVYDPREGRYRLNYGLFIEIFVGLSVIGAVLFYLFSERRKQRRSV